MSARTGWRRKLTVAGHDFLWYVADDVDGQGPVLHLFAVDKTLAVTYFLARARSYPGQSHLIVKERGVEIATPESPDWVSRSAATPAFVREIAEWVVASVRGMPDGSA